MTENLFDLPKIGENIVVVTNQMVKFAKRTLAVLEGNGLVVWSGHSRIGKTTTAKWMLDEIEKKYNPIDPDTFHALHYEVAQVPTTTGNDMKKGVRSLMHAALGRVDESLYRRLPTEDLAQQLVHALRRRRVQMIFIDEAGCLTLDAIRGMVTVRNIAENQKWRLSLVFIGMDDLPRKMTQLPQINYRVHEWCYFKPYDFEETWKLLAALHPYFAGLKKENSEHEDQVKFIHEHYGGVPGQIVPFMRKLNARINESDRNVDMLLLQAVHMSTVRDKERAIEDSMFNYKKSENKKTSTKVKVSPKEVSEKPKKEKSKV